MSKIHVIKMFARDNYRDHAYPVTDDIFWLWHGTWYTFGITIDDQNVTVSPPDEFIKRCRNWKGREMGNRYRKCWLYLEMQYISNPDS